MEDQYKAIVLFTLRYLAGFFKTEQKNLYKSLYKYVSIKSF